MHFRIFILAAGLLLGLAACTTPSGVAGGPMAGTTSRSNTGGMGGGNGSGY